MKLTGIDYRSSTAGRTISKEVLRMFSDPRHPKGQTYVRNTVLDGRPVLRMMDPEYAAASCLSCHGAPKGGKDITGGHKRDGKKGTWPARSASCSP